MSRLLKAPITVALDQLYLDPNNPRLAREQRPGYAGPEGFFAEDFQAELEQQIRNRYKLGRLMKAILGMGWLPVDALLCGSRRRRRAATSLWKQHARGRAAHDPPQPDRERTRLLQAPRPGRRGADPRRG